MAIEVKHKFQSQKPDSPDASLIRPSNWNDTHDITLAGSRLVGRAATSAGVAQEISLGAGLEFDGATLKALTPTKESLGLGNVDNTPDANKPVSTPQQEALDEKVTKEGDTDLGGFSSSLDNLGNSSGRNITLNTNNSNFQIIQRNGNVTLQPPTNNCSIVLFMWGSSGTVTMTGWTKVHGSFISGKNHIVVVTCVEAAKVATIMEAN